VLISVEQTKVFALSQLFNCIWFESSIWLKQLDGIQTGYRKIITMSGCGENKVEDKTVADTPEEEEESTEIQVMQIKYFE